MKTRKIASTQNKETTEDPTLQSNHLPDRSSTKLINESVNVCFFNSIIQALFNCWISSLLRTNRSAQYSCERSQKYVSKYEHKECN